MRRKIISETVEAIFDQIECSFLQKTHCSYLSCSKKLFGAEKIIFGALGRHFFQTLVTFHKLRIFQKLRIKIVESMLSLNTYHSQTAFKTWGFFQKMRINPHLLKALFKADLLVRWLQASTGTFQKVRIESSILENSPKSTMGRVYHPFFGGKSYKKWLIFWGRFPYVYKKYILQKNWTKTVNPALSSDINILPPAIWASHCQLDDHQINPNINNRDHLDG